MPKQMGMLRWLWITPVVILLDQWSKIAAVEHLGFHIPVKITFFFNLNLAYNYGAAFSFLDDAGGWQRWFFTVLAFGVSALLINWMRQLKPQEQLQAIAFAFIIGGAIGNVIDRLYYGYVVDFIQWHYAGWAWPTFNLADAAINLGAALWIIDMIKQSRAQKRAEQDK